MNPSEHTPLMIAEAIERARIELLRQGPWDELRPSERAARLDMMLQAMAAGGVTATLKELVARSAAVDDLTARLTECRGTLGDLRTSHAVEVAALEREIAALRDARAALEVRAAEAEARCAEAREQADEAESLLADVREDLGVAAGLVVPNRQRGLFSRKVGARR